MKKKIIALLSLLCFSTLFGTGCGASITKEEQSAIDCVNVLRRKLVDVQSLEIRGDIIHTHYEAVYGKDSIDECDYIQIGYKDKYGTMHNDIIMFRNGEIQGSISEALVLQNNLNAQTTFAENPIEAIVGFNVYQGMINHEISCESVVVSGKKVAKETSSTFVELK